MQRKPDRLGATDEEIIDSLREDVQYLKGNYSAALERERILLEQLAEANATIRKLNAKLEGSGVEAPAKPHC